MNDTRAAIEQAVEGLRDDALQLLQELVRIPSLEGEERACQDLIAARYAELGMEVDYWAPDDEELAAHPAYVPTGFTYENRPNVVGTWRGTGGGPSLKLNGHVDVVPIGPPETWQYPPFGGELVDGRVYGRGAADMKGGCVVNWLCVAALQRAGLRLRGDLLLESVVDEEGGGNGTLAAVLRGYTADGCIFTEPTGLGEISVSNRGAQYFRITVAGQEGGTEYKHQLVNPIAVGMKIFEAVEDYSLMRESQVSHPLYDGVHDTLVPTGICKFHCGEWPSTIASQAVLEGTIECLPGEDIHAIKADFRRYIEEVARRDPWLRENPPKMEWFGLWFDAAEIAPDHALVRCIQDAAEATIGARPEPRGGGGCDLRLPVLYGDTPSVLYGPAGAMIHSTDEFIELEEVLRCAKVIAHVALDWCGQAEG